MMVVLPCFHYTIKKRIVISIAGCSITAVCAHGVGVIRVRFPAARLNKDMANWIKDHFAEYVGFVALGLSDGIVEITGVHAGFLGVTGSTLIAGISGVIVGVAAAISMGAAAYLQAKQDPTKSAFASALTTGFSYLGAAICLALPYFLIRTMLTAFIISSGIGVILLAAFNYYNARLHKRKFWREFLESVVLLFATALVTYILGTIVGHAFHVNSASF